MAIIQLRSTNPELSRVIDKNPASGMQIRQLKKGDLFYWFHDGHFNIRFLDAPNETSYGEDEFEYLDLTRYNSTMFVVNAISDLFGEILKTRNEHDVDGHTHTLIVGMLNGRGGHYRLFNKHFDDFEIVASPLPGNNIRLAVSTKRSLHHLLNFVSVLGIIMALRNDEAFPPDKNATEKYLRCLSVIDTPYFIRYVFKVNFLVDYLLFKEYKSLLEAGMEKIEMQYGSTQDMRRASIQKQLGFKRQIVDIGCGEGFYIKTFARKIPDRRYIAIDSDERARKTVERNMPKWNIKNASIYSGVMEYMASEEAKNESDFILAEVIEHMELEDARTLLATILAHENTRDVAITTPNADFNRFYLFEEGQFRHDDHKFEFTETQYDEFINSLTASKYEVSHFKAGDTVNGICSTFGTLFRRRDERG